MDEIGQGAVYETVATGLTADRIKYNASGVAAYWWERTPNSGIASSVRRVNTDGTLYNSTANNANGLAPDCEIVRFE